MIQKILEFSPNLQPMLKFVLLFVVISIVILALFSLYQAHEDVTLAASETDESDLIADKVTLIMQMYNCKNPQIFEAIMDTFDPVLVATIIAIESEFRPNAISPAGARGLMQLTPDKLDDWKNISKNIKVGSSYLKEQMDRFGTLDLAIAAYNAGPHSVAKYRGIPPYKETIQYVKKSQILLHYLKKTPWT